MNIKNNNQIEYDEIQINAIRCALTNKVMVLTGGPGTGKTTTVLGIIKAFKECGCNIQLAAPTGKAAKRLSDVTGMSAKTIHRLLEYSPTDGYKKNENHLLKGDVIIIDECSMIDILLMYNLLKAIPDTMNVILVGDADQLPSVGAGNVFKDIINSNTVPVVKLERIFRQAESSKIITNAHRINKGLLPDLSVSKESDFFFIEESDPEKAAEMIQNLCGERLPKRYHIDPVKEIQVLSPMQKGTAGTINLNMLLQKVLNKNTLSITHCGIEFKLHDKVMQLRNNYDKDIYNGDVGFIINIDTDNDSISVNFDGRIVQYNKDELDELTLSYAITVHKSQGGEFPFVIIPLLQSHKRMLQRNLLYTGITRAKRMLIIVGDRKAIAHAVSNNAAIQRNTRLSNRLQLESPVNQRRTQNLKGAPTGSALEETQEV